MRGLVWVATIGAIFALTGYFDLGPKLSQDEKKVLDAVMSFDGKPDEATLRILKGWAEQDLSQWPRRKHRISWALLQI